MFSHKKEEESDTRCTSVNPEDTGKRPDTKGRRACGSVYTKRPEQVGPQTVEQWLTGAGGGGVRKPYVASEWGLESRKTKAWLRGGGASGPTRTS